MLRLAFEGGWTKSQAVFHAGTSRPRPRRISASIAELSNKIAATFYRDGAKGATCQRQMYRLSASTSFFVPKPFTPFQWAPMYENTEYIARAAIVKHAFQDQLNRKSLKYNWHDAEVTVLEGILARGDRKGSEN